MRGRLKTKRRLAVLVVGIAMVITGSVFYLVRTGQIESEIARSRGVGLAAFAAGDYRLALRSIGPYIRRHPMDAGALYAYARSREEVPLFGDRHLPEAAALFSRVLLLQPNHEEAVSRLRELQLQIGHQADTLIGVQGLPAGNSATLISLADDTAGFTGSPATLDRGAELLSDPHIVPLPAAVWSAMALMGAIGAMRLLNWARAA